MVGAARTAIGNLNGGLSSIPAPQLGAVVIREVLARARVSCEVVDEVYMGQVLTAGSEFSSRPRVLEADCSAAIGVAIAAIPS